MCEDELICDLAETYNITDWRGLPPTLVATLAVGLDVKSRTKMKLSGAKITLERGLLAMLIDEMRISNWLKTKDGAKGRNRPESLYKKLAGIDKKPKDELMSMTTDEFDAWYEAKRKKYNG